MASNNESNTFNHACNNYNAFVHLKSNSNFDDWVITTGFYSALKFLEDKLFPGDYEHPKRGVVETFKTFNNYVSALRSLGSTNSHRVRLKLIENNIEDLNIINYYRDLEQSCHSARYIDYKVGKDRLDMCTEAVEAIRTYCV
ncbi:MAG: hypothetical protein ACPGUU_08055 [Flavobacteriaceae bacterium]